MDLRILAIVSVFDWESQREIAALVGIPVLRYSLPLAALYLF